MGTLRTEADFWAYPTPKAEIGTKPSGIFKSASND